MDFHHPILNTLWGHGGRSRRRRRRKVVLLCPCHHGQEGPGWPPPVICILYTASECRLKMWQGWYTIPTVFLKLVCRPTHLKISRRTSNDHWSHSGCVNAMMPSFTLNYAILCTSISKPSSSTYSPRKKSRQCLMNTSTNTLKSVGNRGFNYVN